MIEFPFFTMQQLNLDWLIEKVKGMLSFLPDDGTAGQILRRTADGAEWSDEETGGGGAVDSVNGQTGTVVLGADDILMNDNTTVEDSVTDLKSALDNISYVGKTITDGWYIDSTNGNAASTAAWAYATFNVEGLDGETATIATKLYSGSSAGWVVLLKDGTISASGTTENATITLPENVDVVKISCFKNALSPENIKLNCDYSKQLAYKKDIPNIDPLVGQLYEEETVLYATYKDEWDKGFLNANGGVTLTNAWRTCDFVEIPSDSTLTYKLSMYTGVYYIAFYDANQQYISNSAIQSTITNNWQNKYTTGTAVIPNGAKYVRFSFRADNDSLYNDQSVTVNYARISALEDDIAALENKEKITARVLIIGDSYSANSDKWIAPMMEEFSDDSSYISLAVSSATVKDQSNDRTTYPYSSRPVSSNTTPNTNTFGCQIAKLKRLMAGTDLDTGETAIYQSESEYPNIIIIQGGENDWKDGNTSNYIAQYEAAVENAYYSRWGNVSQGTVYIKPDVETVDRTTFAGAYRYLMDELYALFPKAQYFFTTTSPVAPHQNPVVSLRRDVAEQQRFCANLNCVSVIDWQAESQMSIIVNSVSSGDGTQANPYVVTPTTQDSTDGLHPTEYGGKKLGKLAAHIINSRFMGLA